MVVCIGMYCTHPTCEVSTPHRHLFLHEHCKAEKHRRCKGHAAVTASTTLAEEDIIKKHRRQMDELFADGDPGSSAIFQINELHRREWERLVEARGKATASRIKVWTCTCECHDEIRRTELIASDWNIFKAYKPWQLEGVTVG